VTWNAELDRRAFPAAIPQRLSLRVLSAARYQLARRASRRLAMKSSALTLPPVRQRVKALDFSAP
jgi:hypothetical protein